MPAVTQNKITPVLVIATLAIVGYIVYGRATTGTQKPVRAGAPLAAVPSPNGPDGPARTGGLLGLGALSASPPERRADADNPGETLKTLTASNNDLRAQVQKVLDANQDLQRENANLRADQAGVIARTKEQVLTELRAQSAVMPSGTGAIVAASPSAPSSAPQIASRSPTGLGEIVDSATEGAGHLIGGLGAPAAAQPLGSHSDIPSGLGYDSEGTNAQSTVAAKSYVRVLPAGYRESTGAGSQKGLVRPNGTPVVQGSAPSGPEPGAAAVPGNESKGKKSEHTSKPYFTIPENATLTRGTLMTALVGRVPIDGRVQDPMPFKLIVGRENLAANGQYVPDDISGAIVSGIAIGDMALSCSEGLVQSVTFVFDDGTIQTVSLKKNGATGGMGGGTATIGAGSQSTIAQSTKLAWLSDEFGNPCISGKFVTNAPAYLTDVVGLKTLSTAAQASSLTQTTTSASPLGATNSVTGNKGSFVLGQAASAGVDEISSWIMRRLNNSFDAVVTPAGERVVLHVEQDIAIDKSSDARRLDYARAQREPRGGRTLD